MHASIARVAAAIGMVMAALPPFASQPTAALADNGFTDITGSAVHVDIRYPDRDSGSMTELPIPSDQLDPQAQQFLSTPLSQWFDQYWSGTPDSNGKTVRDNSCDAASNATKNSVYAATGQVAYGVSCKFASTGTLGAKQANQFLQLSYLLPHNVIDFKVTTPGPLPASDDPEFTLTFDTELEVSLSIPDSPCPIQPAGATAFTHNAVIDSANFTGDLVKDVINIFSSGTFSSAESELDNSTQPIQLNLGSTLSSLTSGCDAARQNGFVQFDAPIDASQGKLTFRVTHPLDNAPGPVDVFAQAAAEQAQAPLFERPSILLSQSEISPGTQLTVKGTAFQPAETSLHISWVTATSGPVRESDVQWGPQGGQLQDVTINRHGGADGLNQFQTGDLTPGATYQVRVRDCDAITCTPYSNWLLATMAPKGSDQVTLFLDSETTANQVGSTVVNGDGTFTAEVTVPAGTAAGAHTVFANIGGSISAQLPLHLATNGRTSSAISNVRASTSLSAPVPQPAHTDTSGTALINTTTARTLPVTQSTIPANLLNTVPLAGGQNASAPLTVCAGNGCQPVLQVVDSGLQTITTTVMEGDQVTVLGSGFSTGEVALFLDSASGQLLGGGGVGSDGSFTTQIIFPRGTTGNHTLLGVEKGSSGGTEQAVDALFIEQIPR